MTVPTLDQSKVNHKERFDAEMLEYGVNSCSCGWCLEWLAAQQAESPIVPNIGGIAEVVNNMQPRGIKVKRGRGRPVKEGEVSRTTEWRRSKREQS